MKNIHALLVDDDRQALATMETILEMDDFIVSTADSGRMALERLEGGEADPQRVDIMVVDLDMGNLSGIELLLEMRMRGHSLPVMVVTGYASRATVVELLRQGVADFLDKPMNMDEFRTRINRMAKSVLQLRRENRPRQSGPQPPRTLAATVVDLANLGLPYAARRLLDTSADSHLVLASRKASGFDLLLADVNGFGTESFYVSVLIKSYFDRRRAGEEDGREFMRRLNEVLREGCLERTGVNALYVRIRTGERRMEVFPAGYASRWYLGQGEEDARVIHFAGTPLGFAGDPRETICEIPFSCRDRLLLLGEGGFPAAELPEPGLDKGAGPLEEIVDRTWADILAGSRERRQHDILLLGIELP